MASQAGTPDQTAKALLPLVEGEVHPGISPGVSHELEQIAQQRVLSGSWYAGKRLQTLWGTCNTKPLGYGGLRVVCDPARYVDTSTRLEIHSLGMQRRTQSFTLQVHISVACSGPNARISPQPEQEDGQDLHGDTQAGLAMIVNRTPAIRS